MKKSIPGMYEAIINRRSTRKFTDERVTKEQATLLIEAGFFAPSARAKFPTHFIFVDEAEKLALLSEIQPHGGPIAHAPCAIVICADQGICGERFAEDCSAAAMNVLLAGEALGLSSCWCALYPHEGVGEKAAAILSIPEGMLPFCMLAVGHGVTQPLHPNRVVPSRIHHNLW